MIQAMITDLWPHGMIIWEPKLGLAKWPIGLFLGSLTKRTWMIGSAN